MPVQPSDWRVASWPFVATLAASQKLLTVVGIIRQVNVFWEGCFAAGKNSLQKAIHSGLSTQLSGKPADAMRRVRCVSKLLWLSGDQTRAGLILMSLHWQETLHCQLQGGYGTSRWFWPHADVDLDGLILYITDGGQVGVRELSEPKPEAAKSKGEYIGWRMVQEDAGQLGNSDWLNDVETSAGGRG